MALTLRPLGRILVCWPTSSAATLAGGWPRRNSLRKRIVGARDILRAALVAALWIYGQCATLFVNELWGRRDILRADLLPNLAVQTCVLHEFVCLVSYRSWDLFFPVESLGKCIYWSLDEMGLKHVRQRPHPRQWLLYLCASRSDDTRVSSACMAEGGRGSEQGAFPLLA